jgi:O-antigen/teichoic acid export membrane protein
VRDPAPQAPLTQTVVRGAGLSAVGFVATQVLTLAAYVVLARLAPPSTFGAFAAASIVVTTGMFVTESGMTAALVQRSGPINAAAATATVSTFIGGVLLSLLALALAPVVGAFFQSAEIGEVAAANSGLLFFHAAPVVPGALLQRRLSLRPRLITEPLAAVVLGVTSGLALAAGLGVWGLAVGAYASALFRAASMWLLGGWLPRFADASWALWRDLARYARHVLASEALSNTNSIVTTAVVGRGLGTAPLGQFRYGWRMITAGASVTSAAGYLLLPALSRIAAEPERLRNAFERSLRVAALTAFPFSFLFLALGEPLAILLFGDVWAEAGRVAMALSGIASFTAVGLVSSEVLKAAGRPDLLPRTHGLNALVTISLVLAFLPFGPVGVGLGISIGMASSGFYVLVCAASVVGSSVRVVLRQLSTPATAGAAAAGVTFALDRFVLHAGSRSEALGFVLLGFEMLLGAFIYVVLVAALSKQFAVELRAIRELLVPRLWNSNRA